MKQKEHHLLMAPLVVFVVAALGFGIFGYAIFNATAESLKDQMSNQCLGIATATATFIESDVEGYEEFISTLDRDCEYYRTIKPQLEKIQSANDENIRFLYTEVQVSDDTVMFILDGEKEDSELFSPPGTTETFTSTRVAAYESKTDYVGDGFTVNKYGELLSAYAPIYNKSGDFVGFVGVDISADQYNRVLKNLLFVFLAGLVALTILMAILSSFLIRSYNERIRAHQESLSKSGFLARMSHEIRTPMNAIIGMNEMMLREDLPPIARTHALNIKGAASSLLSLINDILDFSKTESGEIKIVNEPYCFSSLVNNVLNIIRMRLQDKPILLVANIDCDVPAELIGDEARIQQVLLNVLSNAVKYTREGTIILSVSAKCIDARNYLLEMSVEDTGIGIKEESLDQVFKDFAQLDPEKNKGIEGTGLGLAIVKNFSEAMGGSVQVKSVYGKGSTFTISVPQGIDEYLPFAKVESPQTKEVLVYEPRFAYADSICHALECLEVSYVMVTTNSLFLQQLKEKEYTHIFLSSFIYDSVKRGLWKTDIANAKVIVLTDYGVNTIEPNVGMMAMPAHSQTIANIVNDMQGGDLQNESKKTQFIAPEARILVVDDISANSHVAEGLMAPLQVKVDIAESGAEAIDLIQSNAYDLVLMDHMMPGMDGIEATHIIRSLGDENPYFANLPIVALTANAVVGMKDMFIQNGMNDFVAKPIDVSKLNSVLEKWIPAEKQKKYKGADDEISRGDFILEGINASQGVSMTGGVDNYLRVLYTYKTNCQEKYGQIQTCIESSDVKLFTTYVHGLKSASASVGATALSERAKRLEDAGTRGDIDFIANNIEAFLREIKKTIHTVDTLIEKYTSEESKDANDLSDLVKSLNKLKEALAAIDIKVINEAQKELKEGSWPQVSQEKLTKLHESILLFEYDDAIEEITDLLQSLA